MQAMADRYSSSFSDAASSIIARWRPEYSSTIASCTMVSSRCVAGLSTGMRAFSAIATIRNATSASASDTRRPTWRDSMNSAMVESCVDPATSASVSTIISIAGSAQRGDHHLADGADAAEAGADIHAGQRQQEARAPSSAVMAIRSPDQENSRPVAKVGTSAARHPGEREDQIGRGAEQPGGVLGQHHLLAEQPAQVAIGLQQRRRRAGAAAAPSPCAPSRSAAAPAAAPAPSARPAPARSAITAIARAPAAARPGRRTRSAR